MVGNSHYMIVLTNLNKYKLNINEDALISSIKGQYRQVKAPIYIQFDKRLNSCYGLHRCKEISYWQRLPSIIRENIDEVKKNKNCFHHVTVSLARYKSIRKNSKQIKDWNLDRYYDSQYRFKDVYLLHLLAHEIQHAKQVENGKQFDKIRNKRYISCLDSHSLSSADEFDAEVGAIIYGPRLVRSYYKFCEH